MKLGLCCNSCFVSTGLLQLDPGCHPSTSFSAAPIGDECSCPADFSVVEIRPRHSGSSSTPLAEGSRTDWLQTRRPRIQMPAWIGTAVPHRRTLPTSWSRGSTATACARPRLQHWLSAELDSPPSAIEPSRSARVWSNLPQHVISAPFLHVFASRLKTHFFSVSFPEQFWMYSACEVTDFVIIRHCNRPSYVLTQVHKRVIAMQAMQLLRIGLARISCRGRARRVCLRNQVEII